VAPCRRGARDSRCVVLPAPRPRPLITAPPPPARVQVVSLEFRFALSRQTIKAGDAIIELRNQGEDAHDLRLRRIGGTRTYLLPLTQSGQTVDRELELRPGTYRLYCSVANHRALGMQATLVVKR
jgi:plastocyanin